jgi:large subunit ribosomal protein L10
MTRDDKTAAIAELQEELGNSPFFYLADSSTLTVAKINQFRRMCYEKGVKVKVAKNTLIRKALEAISDSKGYEPLFEVLHGPTTILISDNPKAPAKLIEEFRKTSERPILKAAYIDSSVFIGDEQLKALVSLKSKDELVGEIIGLLQSPARTLASQITASGSKIAGIVKALEERAA